MNCKTKLIVTSAMFPLFILSGILSNYKNDSTTYGLGFIFIASFYIHTLSRLKQIYNNDTDNFFATFRTRIGFYFCSLGQIILSYFLHKVIKKDNKISLQNIFYTIALCLVLLNLFLRWSIIIINNFKPLKNDINIQLIYSDFNKKRDFNLKCPFEWAKKYFQKNCTNIIIFIKGIFIIMIPLLVLSLTIN